jgi:hypothetical protein
MRHSQGLFLFLALVIVSAFIGTLETMPETPEQNTYETVEKPEAI